ncbi:Uncharacterised protein [uncultured archaeon]|nr:Uncharacterised protein [uncultured archaeon]
MILFFALYALSLLIVYLVGGRRGYSLGAHRIVEVEYKNLLASGLSEREAMSFLAAALNHPGTTIRKATVPLVPVTEEKKDEKVVDTKDESE